MTKTSFLLSFLLLITVSGRSQDRTRTASEILLGLHKLNTLGSVLYIAAHPDDENTRLLSYYANEKKYSTAYLSLTRGDGGQNLIGTEQGDLLGVIRTQELLAARRIDGAEQFFTRAIDFGYSKNPEETFQFWNKDSILYDVVWTIRNFRPDIIILRFPVTGEGGHGHHTASAIAGLEAFSAAADPSVFPDQLKYCKTWQAQRIFFNMFRPKAEDVAGKPDIIPVDIGTYNSLLGKSYGEIASESRSMHKSQGFGAARSRGSLNDYLKFLAGKPFETDEMSGVTCTWDRAEAGGEIRQTVEKIIREFKPAEPAGSIPALLGLRNLIRSLDIDPFWRSIKLKETEELIFACGGFYIEAIADNFSVVQDDTLSVKASVIHRSPLSCKFLSVEIRETGLKISTQKDLSFNQPVLTELKFRVPEKLPFSNPYWLEPRTNAGLFPNPELQMTGVAEGKASLNIDFTILIDKDTFFVSRPVSYKWVDPVRGELYRSLEVLPEVSIHPAGKINMFIEGRSREISYTLRANSSGSSGVFRLNKAPGWTISPDSHSFTFGSKNEEQKFTFLVTPPAEFSETMIKPEVETGKEKISKSVERINYEHIPVQTLVQDVRSRFCHLDLNTPPLKVAYIEGAGDNIPVCLEQIGYNVTVLDDDILSNGDLSAFDVIITGIRLYNTNERMNVYQPRLMNFVKEGGTLLVQYNTNNFISSLKSEIGPYPFKITRERVTDENAEVRFLQKEHPLLNQPNRIKASDFKGWVQERGLYFAGDYGAEYKALFSMNDPGGKELEGSLIYAGYGKGHFIYTGIAFFRELPAGVPGAYRLFVNLMSAGRPVHD